MIASLDPSEIQALDETLDELLTACAEIARGLQVPVTDFVQRAVSAHCEATDKEIRYFETSEEDEISPREGPQGGVEVVLAVGAKWIRN